ncbi:hypothetical protein EDC01DRAFT_75681 [Geopyxis carbonaria]|nr:hypothetical protein EDC01DRAFT_75681 [Geopyxis carbonaria]
MILCLVTIYFFELYHSFLSDVEGSWHGFSMEGKSQARWFACHNLEPCPWSIEPLPPPRVQPSNNVRCERICGTRSANLFRCCRRMMQFGPSCSRSLPMSCSDLPPHSEVCCFECCKFTLIYRRKTTEKLCRCPDHQILFCSWDPRNQNKLITKTSGPIHSIIRSLPLARALPFVRPLLVAALLRTVVCWPCCARAGGWNALGFGFARLSCIIIPPFDITKQFSELKTFLLHEAIYWEGEWMYWQIYTVVLTLTADLWETARVLHHVTRRSTKTRGCCVFYHHGVPQYT